MVERRRRIAKMQARILSEAHVEVVGSNPAKAD